MNVVYKFIMENPIEMDLGGTHILGNLHMIAVCCFSALYQRRLPTTQGDSRNCDDKVSVASPSAAGFEFCSGIPKEKKNLY